MVVIIESLKLQFMEKLKLSVLLGLDVQDQKLFSEVDFVQGREGAVPVTFDSAVEQAARHNILQ